MSYKIKSEALAQAIVALIVGGVDDSHCYRNLVDNLYAYRVCSVNSTGKWDTKKIKEHCAWTISARISNDIEKEHVVPMAEIVRILLSLTMANVESVYNVIDNYCIYCMVTKSEHDILNAKYQRKMPNEFWDHNSVYFQDPWARYKLSGVKVIA